MNKRQQQEKEENLVTIPNDAPKGRFQNDQQVQNTMDIKSDAGDQDFSLKRLNSKGSELKQEAVAKVIKGGASSGSSDSGMSGSAAGSRGVSGAAGGVLGSANSTPIADKSRKDSRYGKKLDRLATKLNFTPCEVVLEDYDESKPLAEAKDADQGYNGTYRNEFARSQKKNGNTPAELMFQRSVDFIYKDQLYFGQGQYVKQSGVVYKDMPTKSCQPNSLGIFEKPDHDNYSMPCGNYLHRKMYVTLSYTGEVEEIYFDVESLDCVESADRMNRASAAGAIDRNSAELSRQDMDAKAGDEKADIWTPLARAIDAPTQTVAFLRILEAMTGNEVMVAYRKACTSLSYQLNRAQKDGQTIVDPGVEALLGILENPNSADVLKTAYPSILSVLRGSGSDRDKEKVLNSAGCAGLMITAYDSPTKYANKQDLLLQPRSFRMHLQTADNNMGPLRADKRFAQAYSATEAFSTIGREYDPLQPICVTDKAAVITRLNLNRLFAKVRCITGYTTVAAINSHTEFSAYPVLHKALTQGCITSGDGAWYIHALLADNSAGHGAFTLEGDDNNVITPNTSTDSNKAITVIFDHSATQITSVSIGGVTYYEHQSPFALTSALSEVGVYLAVPSDVDPDDFNTRIISVLDGGDFHYMYSDLRNKYVVHTNLPLIQGIIKYFESGIGGKMYGLTENGHLEIPMVHSTCYFSLWSFLVCAATPFIVKERINSMRDILYYEENVGYPFAGFEKLDSIGMKSYSNFTFTDYDNYIDAGLMKPAAALRWVFPEMFWTAKSTQSSGKITSKLVVMPFYMNQVNYNLASDGSVTLADDESAMTMPSIRSGVRLASLDMLYGMSEKDIRLAYDMALPFIPSKATSGTVYKYGMDTDGIIAFGLEDTDAADISIAEWLSQARELGWIIDAPYGVLTKKVISSITTPYTVESVYASFAESATRGSSYRIRCYHGKNALRFSGSGEAILSLSAVNVNRAENYFQEWYEVVANGKRPDFDCGMLFSLNHLLVNGALATGISKFTPFYNEGNDSQPANVKAISLMKGLWTRLQKLPFAISPFEGEDNASADIGLTFDPFDLCYICGCCGFRASDYRESVYNREKEFINQGELFVSDPWVEQSPIFKEGAVTTGITTTRGFEV